MTDHDKARLRKIMSKYAHNWSDADAAEECNCTVATARKYRQALAPSHRQGTSNDR